ncbi:MAG: extracellular solute-binding protein [Anaerolineae bacterium]|nr:extracellular solute-binding protein [Anaerolineae bacterium]
MKINQFIPIVAATAVALAACSSPAPAPTTAPAKPAATTAPAAPAATTAPAAPAKPTEAPKPTAVANPVKVSGGKLLKTPEEVDAIALSKDKKTEVIFWHRYSGEPEKAFTAIIDSFNKSNEYGIEVKLEKAGGSYQDVYNKINAATVAGSNLPAVSVAYINQAATYRDYEVVINLDPFIKSKKYGLNEADIKDIPQAFLNGDKALQWQGETLGWATQRSMEVLYTNLDWLQKLGYKAPPTNFKDFEEMACKASNKDKGEYGFALTPNASSFAAFVFAFGGNILKPDGSGYDFNSPAALEASNLLRTMFQKGCAVEIPRTENNGDQTRFAAQKVLFTAGSSTGATFYAQAIDKSPNKFKFTYSMFPQKDPANPRTNLYGASWSVFKVAPEQQLGAWLFIRHFITKENTAGWAKSSGYMAVRQSAADQAIADAKANPVFKDYPEVIEGYTSMYKMVQFGQTEAPVAGYDPVRAEIENNIISKAIWKGEGDLKAMLDNSVKKANDILKENAPLKK